MYGVIYSKYFTIVYSSCIENYSFVHQHNISVSLDTHVLTLVVASMAAPAAVRSLATAAVPLAAL